MHGSYKALMARLHPDRFGMASQEEKLSVADQAAAVTDAYSELKQPHRRASHLLELLVVALTEGDNGSLIGPPILMEIMELREELEALGANPNEGRLAELRTRNRTQLDALSSELALAFASSQLDDARRLTSQLQYLQRIHQEIDSQTPAA